MNTLPSSAYTGSPLGPHPMVVSRPWVEVGRRLPVLRSRNAPVPYVFFACPGFTQPCPNNAACWSPAMPVTGISTPRCSAAQTPNIPLELRISGKDSRRTPNSLSSSSSQARLPMSYSIVRDALV